MNFFELTFRFGVGIDFQHIESEIEPCELVDEDDKEETAILEFSGLRILIPFIQIRIGQAEVHTK